jgi:hypothetical protein
MEVEDHELRIKPIPVEVKDGGFKLPEDEDNYDYQDD